jgi:protoheme IX farnesyltransferase
LLVEPGALFLFALLFLWQLPHFLAINWMYRDEYLRGGFVMLANEDEHGKTTSTHALGYALAMVLLMFYPVYRGLVHTVWFLPFALLLSGWLSLLAWRFFQTPERLTARKLFFCTLAYLPALLLLAALTWR